MPKGEEKQRSCRRYCCSLFLHGLLLASGLVWSSAYAVNLTIQPGDTVSPGVPGAGAGNVDVVTDVDTYTFAGVTGQILYLEELSAASTFAGYLQWELRTPSGTRIAGSYLEGNDQARIVLLQDGTYSLQVKVASTNPNYTGDYSFRLWAVPPDEVFAIQVGDSITNGVSLPGAGNLEGPGAQDIYTFQATSGQSAFFRENSVSAAFKGYLQWELKTPGGQRVFLGYIDSGDQGRVTFPQTGTYTLTVWCGLNDVTCIGPYSFSILSVPPDTVIPIQVGQVISENVPAAGAGRIEVPGAEDHYTFQGSAGQSLFFDVLSVESSLGGYLQWELSAPGGTKVFTSFFSTDVGRKTLPETGTYTLRFRVAHTDPALLGQYSFQITPLEDSAFAINLGLTVTNSVPGQGAGNIETAGGQDLYTFTGTAGQRIHFQHLHSAQSFGGYLQYQLRAPSSNQVGLVFFSNGREDDYLLPETGTYSVRVFSALNDATRIGLYAFRIYSPVQAWADQFIAAPGQALLIPKAKFLCNDTGEVGDTLQLSLPNGASAMGGSVVETNGFWRYTPAAGFAGQDSFIYNLTGAYGGFDQATVSLRVAEGAAGQAMAVSWSRTSDNMVDICMLGAPGQTYIVEKSSDFSQWTQAGTVTADANGSMNYQFPLSAEGRAFFRFKRQ